MYLTSSLVEAGFLEAAKTLATVSVHRETDTTNKELQCGRF